MNLFLTKWIVLFLNQVFWKISRACQVEVNDFKYYENFIVSNLWSDFSKEIHHRDGWWWFVRVLLHGGWPCSYAGLSGSGNGLSRSLNYSTLWACQDIQTSWPRPNIYCFLLVGTYHLLGAKYVAMRGGNRVLLPSPL